MPLGGAKHEHFSRFYSSCQYGLSYEHILVVCNTVYRGGTNHRFRQHNLWQLGHNKSMVVKRTITWNLVTVLVLLGFFYNTAYLGYLQFQSRRNNNILHFIDHHQLGLNRVS